jgi:RNA polymerase sigma-70 factor (ECF subfamily)
MTSTIAPPPLRCAPTRADQRAAGKAFTLPGVGAPNVSDGELLAGLRAGDETAFRALVKRYHPTMRRVAMSYVKSLSVADEVVQETWLAVIRGLPRFEERSSLKTWIFRIVINRAQSRAVREQRTTPFSSLVGPDSEAGPTVDPDRFIEGGTFDGYWSVSPSRFCDLPEERLLASETRTILGQAINDLPARQQQVLRLRDVEGWDAEEVCESLGLSAGNQRVLLHRARAQLRSVLEAHFREGVPV